MTEFGLIGCGEIAQKHVEAIHQFGGELIAAADIEVDRAAQLAPFAYDDYQRVLQHPNIDVVAICTPNYLHVPMAIDAIEAGKKVILEKPVSTNFTDALALSRHPLVNQVGINYQRRYNSEAQAIKAYIEDHPKNPPVSVDAKIFVRRDPPYWRDWRNSKEQSGGANLINIDVHYFDLLQWWLGEGYQVNFAKTADRGGIDQATFAQLDVAGVPVDFLGSAMHNKRLVNMEITFDKGNKMAYTKDDGTHFDVYDHFLNQNDPITVQEAIKSLQMVLDIYDYDKDPTKN